MIDVTSNKHERVEMSNTTTREEVTLEFGTSQDTNIDPRRPVSRRRDRMATKESIASDWTHTKVQSSQQ
jgi:hypothetical protein